MISGAYRTSPVLRRQEYTANTTSTRLFNHSYPLKSTPLTPSQANFYQPYSQVPNQPTYPAVYQSSNRLSYPFYQSSNLTANQTSYPNLYQVNPSPALNSAQPWNSGLSVSAKGLEIILIAILILVALDLVVIRPLRQG